MLKSEIEENTLMTSDAEQSLLENLILFIPEGKTCTDILMGIAISANAVFALNISLE
jgi:hypothetical protein